MILSSVSSHCLKFKEDNVMYIFCPVFLSETAHIFLHISEVFAWFDLCSLALHDRMLCVSWAGRRRLLRLLLLLLQSVMTLRAGQTTSWAQGCFKAASLVLVPRPPANLAACSLASGGGWCLPTYTCPSAGIIGIFPACCRSCFVISRHHSLL